MPDDDKTSAAAQQLRQDGPTVAEYVKAGYSAKNYPPSGYASKSTDEEIAAAVKAEDAAALAKANGAASETSAAAVTDQDDGEAVELSRRILLTAKASEGKAGAIVSVTNTRAEQLIGTGKARAATLADFSASA